MFGDGRHGRRPPAGATITETYRAGNGEVTEQFAGVKRVHYYNGQRLTAADFNQEQEYIFNSAACTTECFTARASSQGFG